MNNILKTYTKEGVIITGSDKVELDTPTFEVVNVDIDTLNQKLSIEILHEVMQGSVKQEQKRRFNIDFDNLPSSVKVTGKSFLDAIETEILKLPQYLGSTEV